MSASDEAPEPTRTASRPGVLSAEEAAAHRAGVGYAPDLVSISRRVLYAQAVLIVMVAALFFAAGFALGPGPGEDAPRAADPKESFGKPVLVPGKLAYIDAGGTPQSDAGALVLMIPKGSELADRLPAEGLRPTDPPPADSDAVVETIRFLGGTVLRADRRGEFEATVPAGRYHVLIVSQSAARRENRSVKPQDIEEMSRYFAQPGALIGDRRYEWKLRKLGKDTWLNIALD